MQDKKDFVIKIIEKLIENIINWIQGKVIPQIVVTIYFQFCWKHNRVKRILIRKQEKKDAFDKIKGCSTPSKFPWDFRKLQ